MSHLVNCTAGSLTRRPGTLHVEAESGFECVNWCGNNEPMALRSTLPLDFWRMMPLPDLPVMTAEALNIIAERHHASYVKKLPDLGMFNGIFALGDDLILRVPRDNPFPISKTYNEQVAVAAARAAGVRTPAVVTFDDSLKLIAAPYAVYERVKGRSLETLGLEPDETPEVWRELGRDFAHLHCGVERIGAVGEIEAPAYPDPRDLTDDLAEKGYFTKLEARWLRGWLEHLAPATRQPITKRFLHGDPQGTNVMVSGTTLNYLAVLDWGSAKWGDPAWDFVTFPSAQCRLCSRATAGSRRCPGTRTARLKRASYGVPSVRRSTA